jgi:hypothetical protein
MTDTPDTSPEAVERFDLEQPTEHMGSASMDPAPGYGDWVRYSDYVALSAERDALKAENARLREALTPSGDTKADYIGEIIDPDTGKSVSWTAIKMIMKMIAARAALQKDNKT